MATVSTLVNLFGVSKHTIRAWSKEFAPYLSDGARPPQGERRNYNEDDMKVFAFIAFKRGQNAQYQEIHKGLKADEHREMLVEGPADVAMNGQSGGGRMLQGNVPAGFVPAELVETFAQRLTMQFHDQINQLRDHIERLEKQGDYFRDKFEESQSLLRGEQEKWVNAKTMIARMEAELEMSAKQETLLGEERTARMNAINELRTVQAKLARLEATHEQQQVAPKRRGFWSR